MVVYVIWKAFTTYNRRTWPLIVTYVCVICALWIAAFVSAKYISSQTGLTNMAVWTSMIALIILGVFGSVQGLASYWAYTMMKRSLSEPSRRVTFKFMLAIVVTLFFGVARAFWNIANLFGVNVLDDLFSRLIVAGDRNGFLIYMFYFMLVEVVPVTIAIVFLAAEDVDSQSSENNAYNILSYDSVAGNGRHSATGRSKITNSGSFNAKKRAGGVGLGHHGNGPRLPHSSHGASGFGDGSNNRNNTLTLGTGGFASMPLFEESEESFISHDDDFDHTLNDDDLVRENDAPFKNVDFHPGHVVSAARRGTLSDPPVTGSFGSSNVAYLTSSPTRSTLASNLSSGTGPQSNSPYRPIAIGGTHSPHSHHYDSAFTGIQTPNTDPSRLAGGDYRSVAAIQAPHVGVISTVAQDGPVVVVGSFGEPRGAEATFRDFHQMTRPTSPANIPSPAVSPSPLSFSDPQHLSASPRTGKHHFYHDPNISDSYSAVSTSSTPTTTFITTINPSNFNQPNTLAVPRSENTSMANSPASSLPSPEGSYQVPMSRFNDK